MSGLVSITFYSQLVIRTERLVKDHLNRTMEKDKIIDELVYEYLARKEKNAATIFKLNRGPV